MEPAVSYGAREPTTAMERAQERTEEMYADEDLRLQPDAYRRLQPIERKNEVPMDKRADLLDRLERLAATVRELPRTAIGGTIDCHIELGTIFNEPCVHLQASAFDFMVAEWTERAWVPMDWDEASTCRHFLNVHGVTIFALFPREAEA
jgi:hypothetical protein